MSKENIAFIGMMGTSKSTVARLVSAATGLVFFDSDAVFEEEFGSIDAFFSRYGEACFRVEESKIIYRLSQKTNAALSLGGGAVLNPANMSYIKNTCTVMLLTASPEVIYERVKNDNPRPLLKGDVQSNIKRILSEREALYKRYADFTLDTSLLTPDKAAEKALALLARK